MKLGINKRYAFYFSTISLGIIVCMMIFISIIVWRQGDFLREGLREATRTSYAESQKTMMHNLAEYLSKNLFDSLYQLDIENIELYIKDMKAGMPIQSFIITDTTGKVLTDGTDENLLYGMKLPLDIEKFKSMPIQIIHSEEGYKVLFSIRVGEYKAGYGEIVFSDEILKNAIEKQNETVTRIWDNFEGALAKIVFLAILSVIIIAVFLSFVFSRSLSLPLLTLRNAATRIASGDLSQRVEVRTGDEIGDLAISFNKMAEDLQAEMNERMQIEKALAEEKERLSVTLRSIGDGVIVSDTGGRVVLVNYVAEKLTGYTSRETLGKFISDFFRPVSENNREDYENPVEKVIKTGRITTSYQNILISKNKTERFIAYSCAPIHDKKDKTIGAVVVFRDITESQKMEKELQKIKKIESVGILAGGIAHDFNNLLTGILGNINIAKIYLYPGNKAYRRLEEAEKASMRAKDLTQHLLTFSKGGAPIRGIVSAVRIIKDSVNFALSGSNVKCVYDLPDDLMSVRVDEGQISQVMNNLVINAVQAMPKGGIIRVGGKNITVRGNEIFPLKKGSYVKVSVYDQGSGISEENLQKVFDPYFTTKQQGSGLGLAIAYSIVKRHGGLITVESEPGAGTTFYIYLPASLTKVLEGEERVSEEKPLSGQGKILLMDDDAAVKEAVGEMLRTIGYTVEYSNDGEETIKCYREARESGRPFNAVIMDLTIPGGKGGKETIHKLLEIDPGVKAIVSSGYSNDPIMSEFKKYGFSGVIAKPYKIKELSEVVHKVISMQLQD